MRDFRRVSYIQDHIRPSAVSAEVIEMLFLRR
jgi:hypothetical protein